jgi:hypothetical protein
MRRAMGSALALAFVAGLALALRRGIAEARASRARGGRFEADVTDIRDAEPSDDELAERVREQVPIPGGVEVSAQDGAVVLFGRAPRYLVDRLLDRVAAVPGVAVVEDRMTRVDLVAPERPPGPPDPTP